MLRTIDQNHIICAKFPSTNTNSKFTKETYGDRVGYIVGLSLGLKVGNIVGLWVGLSVGDNEGDN